MVSYMTDTGYRHRKFDDYIYPDLTELYAGNLYSVKLIFDSTGTCMHIVIIINLFFFCVVAHPHKRKAAGFYCE